MLCIPLNATSQSMQALLNYLFGPESVSSLLPQAIHPAFSSR